MSEGKRNFIVGLVIVLCYVAWLVYEMSKATPDVQAEVVGLIAFVVIGLVIAWQISGSHKDKDPLDDPPYWWRKK